MQLYLTLPYHPGGNNNSFECCTVFSAFLGVFACFSFCLIVNYIIILSQTPVTAMEQPRRTKPEGYHTPRRGKVRLRFFCDSRRSHSTLTEILSRKRAIREKISVRSSSLAGYRVGAAVLARSRRLPRGLAARGDVPG